MEKIVCCNKCFVGRREPDPRDSWQHGRDQGDSQGGQVGSRATRRDVQDGAVRPGQDHKPLDLFGECK